MAASTGGRLPTSVHNRKGSEETMPNPSYYFTLFKKFQVVNHVPDGSFHGSGSPSGGFDLKAPSAAFGSSTKGPLLGATPATSPLWAVLNAKATGAPSALVGSITW